jgi:hypothetical protein
MRCRWIGFAVGQSRHTAIPRLRSVDASA